MKTKLKRLTDIKCKIPERESEHYKIERFTVTKDDAKWFNLRAAISFSGAGREIEPGTYAKLIKKGTHDPIMSDTPSEIGDCVEAIEHAQGHILINGLGLGWMVEACMQRTKRQPLHRHWISDRDIKALSKQPNEPLVKHITVIEIDQEIIDLVGPYYLKKYPGRLTIIQADALEYTHKTNFRFDVVWHDIWPTICADNIKDMKKLHRKYGGRTKWQGSWCRYECERQRRTG